MIENLDTSVGKPFKITERQSLECRAEVFNILNYVSWGAGRDITAPGSFGQITGQINSPRNIQFGLNYKC